MTEGVTLVNGQDAVDGSVQIGKQTDSPDVPIVEYQYGPVEESKDPEFTVILSDQDISEAELRVRQLTDIQRSISENGVNYETVVALENIQPGIIMNNFPALGYTQEASQQSLQITLERIDGAKLGGIAAVIAVIVASIIALFKKFTNKTDRALEKVPGSEDLQKLEEKVAEKLPDIQTRAKLTEAEIRRNAEAYKWLIDHKIVDIIQLHGRLAPDFNVEAAVKDLSSYLKLLGYGDETRNKLFNISNIIGGHMPRIFYRKDLEEVLKHYLDFLENFPMIVRKRNDSISSLSHAYAQVKYGFDFKYNRNEDILIKAICKFTGVRSYNSEEEAVADMQNKIRNDWMIEDHQKDLTRSHLSAVINSRIKPLIISIIKVKPDLETEFKRLEKINKLDMNQSANNLQNTRNELDKLINVIEGVTDEKREYYREALRKLDAAPEVYKAEYKLMGKLATATMSPIINVASAVLAMHTRVNMYYELIDSLSSILRRFEDEFGEDIK